MQRLSIFLISFFIHYSVSSPIDSERIFLYTKIISNLDPQYSICGIPSLEQITKTTSELRQLSELLDRFKTSDPALFHRTIIPPHEITPACQCNLKKSALLAGHRGYSAIFPEHTGLAYKNAYENKADFLELDIRVTKDGNIVLFHDSDIGRTTNGEGAIKSKTAVELKKLDNAYKFTLDGGKTFPYRGKGLQVLTMEDLLEQFPPNVSRNDNYCIDFKDGLDTAKIFVDVVKKLQIPGNVFIVASTNIANGAAGLKYASENIPTIRKAATLKESIAFVILYYLDHIKCFISQSSWFSLPYLSYVDNEGFIREANRIGILVNYWTINDENLMKNLLLTGADGIITDNVALGLKVFKELGLKS